MESTDLTERRAIAAAAQEAAEPDHDPLTRERAVELYEKLDDAGFEARLTNEEDVAYVVVVNVSSIKSGVQLRRIAELARSFRVAVKGDITGRLRLG